MMKSKIGRNGSVIILFLIIVAANCLKLTEDINNLQELCSVNRYLYDIGPDETFQLILKSEPSNRNINKYQKSKRRCQKEFKALPASHFAVTMSNMMIPSCSEECKCNYLELSEKGLEKRYCGEHKDVIYFESKTNHLAINFQHSTQMTFQISINFTVERNTYIVTGLPKEEHFHSGRFIETPYFPLKYPSDYTAEYILQSLDPWGYVLLLFLDFQISQESYIEIKGHNGTHVDRFTGNTFRPPAIVSSGRELSVKFVANDQISAAGFRAISFFEKGHENQVRESPTICGGSKQSLGGIMTIMPPAKNNLFDCIWRILPRLFFDSKSYLSVSVIDLQNVGPTAYLEFREGFYSKSQLVRSLNCGGLNCSLKTVPDITTSATNGFYIRFNGYLNPTSSVVLSYSTYHMENCTQDEFACKNGRCIQKFLQCDGYDHCTDNSDEILCPLFKEVMTTQLITTESEPATYPYLDRKKMNAQGASGFLIFMMFGITGLILALVVFGIIFYQQYKKRRLFEQLLHQQRVRESSGISPQYYPMAVFDCDRPPSYENFIQFAHQYPPLLYTRAQQRSKPRCDDPKLATTSFACSKSDESLPSFSLHSVVNLVNSNSDCNDKWEEEWDSSGGVEDSLGTSCFVGNRKIVANRELWLRRPLKRPRSLDSGLNVATNDSNIGYCQLYMSICSPDDNTLQCQSLPLNWKVDNANEDVKLKEGSACGSRETNRRFTWSVVTSCSTCDSKIVTSVKARGHSKPCKKITVHCSLKRSATV